MLSWLRKDKKPEIASEKIKPLMLEVSSRLGQEWISGGHIAVDQLDGKPVPVVSFVTNDGIHELLLGDEYSVVISAKDDKEVARFTDITRMAILKYSP